MPKLTVLTTRVDELEPFASIIADELNVREVLFTQRTEEASAAYGVSRVLRVNARAAGPRIGKQVQQAIRGSKSGDWSIDENGSVVAGGVPLVEGEYEVELQIAEAQGDEVLGLLDSGDILVLDTTVTAALAAEGVARDAIRAIQDARKAAGLEVSDRITLRLRTDDDSVAALQSQTPLIAGETLATEVQIEGGLPADPERASIAHSYGALEIEVNRV